MTTNASRRDRVRRFVLAALDIACTELAGLGVFVPGLVGTATILFDVPTTPSATVAAGAAGTSGGPSATRVLQ